MTAIHTVRLFAPPLSNDQAAAKDGTGGAKSPDPERSRGVVPGTGRCMSIMSYGGINKKSCASARKPASYVFL